MYQLFNDTRVTFKEFIDFHDFLRSLDDFAKGLQFLEQQEHTIGPEEFARAMRITTGVQLRDTLVSVVYSIFDVNGDGHLSHKEVMSIMKSRLDRAMRAHMDDNKLSFRRCILVTGAQLRLSGTE